MISVFEHLAAFARSDPGNHRGSIVERKLGMTPPETSGDSLDQDPGVFIDEDGHGESLLVFSFQ